MPTTVSPNIRVRVPAQFEIGDESIIDDWCYFSTRVKIGRRSHVANNVSVAGGPDHLFSLGDFASVSAGVRIWCSSNDFVRDLIALDVEGSCEIRGDVSVGHYTGIGANSVVMPNNAIPDGVAIGALSFVPAGFRFEAWTVYAGIPVRPVRVRDRDRVLAQAAESD